MYYTHVHAVYMILHVPHFRWLLYDSVCVCVYVCVCVCVCVSQEQYNSVPGHLILVPRWLCVAVGRLHSIWEYIAFDLFHVQVLNEAMACNTSAMYLHVLMVHVSVESI